MNPVCTECSYAQNSAVNDCEHSTGVKLPARVGRFTLTAPLIRRTGASPRHVFLAVDSSGQRAVLKFVLASHKTEAGRLKREAELLTWLAPKRLLMPLRSLDCWAVWASRYVDGTDLAVWHDERFDVGAAPSRDALTIMALAAAAVAQLHAKGIAHRDIKPGNFVVGADPPLSVHVIDLGLATAPDLELTTLTDGELGGTPGWCVPVTDDPKRDDVYGLGLLLGWFFTGLAPSRRGSVERGAFARSVRQAAHPATDRRLLVLIERCLGEGDCPTAIELAEALAKVAGAPMPVLPPPPKERDPRTFWAMGGLVAVAAAVAVLAVWNPSNVATPTPPTSPAPALQADPPAPRSPEPAESAAPRLLAPVDAAALASPGATPAAERKPVRSRARRPRARPVASKEPAPAPTAHEPIPKPSLKGTERSTR